MDVGTYSTKSHVHTRLWFHKPGFKTIRLQTCHTCFCSTRNVLAENVGSLIVYNNIIHVRESGNDPRL